MHEKEEKRLRIRVPDWFKLAFLLIAVFAIYRVVLTIPNTIVFFLVGAIFAYILHPFVNWFIKSGLPRWAAVVIVYAIAIVVIALVVYLATPPLIFQLQQFLKDLPSFIERANQEYLSLRKSLPPGIRRFLPPSLEDIGSAISTFASSQLQRLGVLVSRVIAVVTGFLLIVVFSIFILLFLDEIDGWFRLWIPEKYHWLYDRLVDRLDIGYSRYIIGQIIVSAVHGLTVGIVAALFGVPFAIILAIYAAIIQIIPIIGPVLALLPPIALAFTISLRTAVFVAIILGVAFAFEGAFLTPYILGGTAAISPILIFFAIVAGAEVGGAGGAILAVPLLVFLNIIWQFIREHFYYRPAAPPREPPTMIETEPPPE